MSIKVLNVGQCSFDHSNIAALLADALAAHTDFAATARQAMQKLANDHYNLVLVNRILDADGSSGIELIAALKRQSANTPMMLISDLPDAQTAAVAAGAIRGFGKSSLDSPQTLQQLKTLFSNTPESA